MKKSLFYLLVLIQIFALNACSPIKSPMMAQPAAQSDYLVYLIDNNLKVSQLFIYDPISNTSKQILTDWDVNDFSLSMNNSLAFSLSQGENSQIYVVDTPFTENKPIQITFGSARNAPVSWSPDGRLLLINSVQGDRKKLSVWDGKNFSDIYTYHGQIGEAMWSINGQLAFTEFLIRASSPESDQAEVYLWDGNITVSASQNPTGEDRYPAWSGDGRLAFLSERNGEYDIFVWDGKSKHNDAPDPATFVNIVPSLTYYFSAPTWTNIDSIAFSGGSTSDKYTQIYEWDGQTAKNISQNPTVNNGGPMWGKDGYWSSIIPFSNSLYIHNSNNQTILEIKGVSSTWGQNGFLVFCNTDASKKWILSMWNGLNIVEIANGDEIMATWGNGEFVHCTHG